MNENLKAAWLSALRSGEYKQASGTLKTTDCQFCCLGVLCDVVAPSQWRPRSDFEDAYQFAFAGDECAAVLPNTFREMAGISGGQQSHLTAMNDTEGCSFNEIADWIEENL